jgi:hypothetical protein
LWLTKPTRERLAQLALFDAGDVGADVHRARIQPSLDTAIVRGVVNGTVLAAAEAAGRFNRDELHGEVFLAAIG